MQWVNVPNYNDMKNLTAVQWLIKELKIQGMDATVNQALTMEREQIVKAHGRQLKKTGIVSQYWKTGEQYYQENYNT